MLGDPALLHSAIENVVRNATRYTPDGTTVEIHAEKVQKWGLAEAYVKVSDCGPGVPQDALEKIFQPFYRIDDARVRTTGGVGLGLAITDQAVRLHGGSVQSIKPSRGWVLVEIRLPLQQTAAGEVRSQQTPVAANKIRNVWRNLRCRFALSCPFLIHNWGKPFRIRVSRFQSFNVSGQLGVCRFRAHIPSRKL